MRHWRLFAGALSLSGLLCATAASFEESATIQAAIQNPFSYCGEFRTRDTSRQLPAELRTRAAAALQLQPRAAVSGAYFWRCMNGAVYVCAVGANIPCGAKADRAERNAGAEAYCLENRDADVVPAYATGHSTLYRWRCASGIAVRGKAALQLDARGFPRGFWQRLSP